MAIIIVNQDVPMNFESIIREIAESIVEDFYTLPILRINLVKGPNKSDEISKKTVFARANAILFLKGEEPTIEISTAIFFSVRSYESITATVAHEIAHLQLATKCAKPLIDNSLPTRNEYLSRTANLWSDCCVTSFLVSKGYGPSILSELWEITEGYLSSLTYHLSRQKPLTKDERRNYLGTLLRDLATFSCLAKDKRLAKIFKNAERQTRNVALRVFGHNCVKKANKLVSSIERMSARQWIDAVLALYDSQK